MELAPAWATVVGLVGALLTVADWIVVAALGIFVGAGDLIARHRDAPTAALFTRPALFYLALNGAASAIALALTRGLGWNVGADAPAVGTGASWLQVLVSGLGAMAVLRSSVTLGTGENSATVSLSSHLQRYLDAASVEVDRVRGEKRSTLIANATKDISFVRAQKALPATCFALVPNMEAEALADFAHEIAALTAEPDLNDRVKARLLGLRLLDLVGAGVLIAAIRDLGPDIRPPD